MQSDTTVVLPQQGDLTLDEWSGVGYVQQRNLGDDGVSVGMLIGGEFVSTNAANISDPSSSAIAQTSTDERTFGGGFGLIRDTLDTNNIDNVGISIDQHEAFIPKFEAADPVDVRTGHFLYDLPGMSFGGGAPWGLSVGLSYTTADKYSNKGLGYGWSHNYDIRANNYTEYEYGFGMRSLTQGAPTLVSTYLLWKMLNQESLTAKQWLVAAVMADWQMNALTDNTVSVTFEDQKLVFIKLPDGSYAPPPGSTMTLEGTPGNYVLKGRFGLEVEFDAEDRVQSWQDSDGNTVSFSYTGDNLQAVTDTTGRQLTFSYSDEKLSQITDPTGRNVSLQYDTDDNLTQYTDVGGGVWTITYEGDHQIKTVTNPVDIQKVENFYDSLGRVYQQFYPVQGEIAENQIYYAGTRSAEDNSVGDRIVYYFDPLGQKLEQIDQLGHRVLMDYDGQQRVIENIDPKGNRSTVVYDADHNLIETVNALDERSSNVYDDQHHLRETISPLGHKATMTYDENHHLKTSTVYPQPGKTITSQIDYLDNGLPHRSTDPRGTVSTTSYDVYGMADSVRVGSHNPVDNDYDNLGRMRSLTDQEGATTTFVYDDRGNVTRSTDPQGKITIYDYDALGRLKSMTDRNGDTSMITYTPDGEIESVDYPGTKEDASFVYDSRSLVKEM